MEEKGKTKISSIWQISPRSQQSLIEQVLANRGLVKAEDQEKFLNPDFPRDFLNPYLLKDMGLAIDRLIAAIKNNEKIGIFGDYDADGIPGTALMLKGLKLAAFDNVLPLIPNREDGYGLNNKTIDYFASAKVSLLITIDNGIASKEPIAYAQALGIDTIVIDHHEVQEEKKPKAKAIVDHKQPECLYPEKTLCACALVFKTLWALFEKLEINPNKLKWLLDLVAISTVSDLVPLIGENRLLTHFGLVVINKTKNLGLKEIINLAGLTDCQIEAYHLGFVIAPRLNAPSRVGQERDSQDANLILKLLITDSQEEARDLAQIVHSLNIVRQESLEKALAEALQLATKQVKDKRKILVLADQNWPVGVVGLVAGRLVETFSRPAIIFGQVGDNLVGSARSVKGFHLVESLSHFNTLLIKYGGHALAAGLTLKPNKLTDFTQAINQLADQKLSEDNLVKVYKIDAEVKLDEISPKLVDQIAQLAPFGFANPQPIFLIKGSPNSLRSIGQKNNHLTWWFISQEERLKVIAFDKIDSISKLNNGQEIEVIGNLRFNEWQGEKSIQLVCSDFR